MKWLLSAALGGSIGVFVFHPWVDRPKLMLLTALFFFGWVVLCHWLMQPFFQSCRTLPQVFQPDDAPLFVRNAYFFRRFHDLETPVVVTVLWVLKWACLFALLYGGLIWLKDVSPGLPQQIPASFWQDAKLYGRTASSVEVDGDRAGFVFRVKGFSPPGRLEIYPLHGSIEVDLRLQSPVEQLQARQLKPGQGLLLHGRLGLPDPPANPGAFDYPFYLHTHGISMLATVNGLSSIQTAPRWDNPVLLRVAGVADFLRNRLAVLFDGDSYALMQSLLLGDRQMLDKALTDAFSVLGLTHILAISGLHMGLVAAVLLLLCRLLGLTRETGCIVTMILLFGYLVLTGAPPSAVRATIMMEMALLARLIARPADGLLFVGMAYCLMLAAQPHILYDIGFQLSFIVTAGLLMGYTPVSGYFERRWRLFPPLAGLIAVTCIAQAVSFPLLIFYFQQFSPLSWLANLLVVPLFSVVILPAGLVALLLATLHPGLGYGLAWPIQKLAELAMDGAHQLSRLPLANMYWAQPPIWWVLGYYLLLAGWSLLPYSSFPVRFLRAKRLFYASAVLLAGWVALAWMWPVRLGQEVRVVFLDVGQGDAAVIRTSGGRAIVVDAGGAPEWRKDEWRRPAHPYDPGERVVLAFLRHEGIRRVDALIITHSDADHMKGALALLDSNIRIQRIILNGSPEAAETELQRQLLAKAREHQIPVQTVVAGQVWRWREGVALQWLNPSAQTRLSPHENDAAVVFVLHAYGKRVLFSADVEAGGERAMLSRDWGWRGVDVLKVGHHGSKTSSTPEWLTFTRPQIAVVSVGKHNIYGHPDQEVLGRLHAVAKRVFRTDINGAVVVEIRPREMRTWSLLP